MDPEAVKELIQEGIPGANIEVVDTTGTKDHFSAIVISDSFEGLSLVEQHQAVYQTVGNHMTKEIHALQLKTYSPAQWAQHNT
jgi:acid stress-induced BolA-like protein IbaG/YrbA